MWVKWVPYCAMNVHVKPQQVYIQVLSTKYIMSLVKKKPSFVQ